MDISDRLFLFANKPSRISSATWSGAGIVGSYELRFLYVETELMNRLRGTVENAYVQNNKTASRVIVGRSYDNAPMIFDAEIVSETPIDDADLRKIEQWLFHQIGFRKLYAVDENGLRLDPETINSVPVYQYLNCYFDEPERLIYSGGCFGWKCTVECDSYLAHQDAVTYVPAIENGAFSVTVDSDKFGYTWPVIELRLEASSGDPALTVDLHLSNSSLGSSGGEPKDLWLLDVPLNQTLTIDCANNTVVGSVSQELFDNLSQDADKRSLIGLLNGENTLQVSAIVHNQDTEDASGYIGDVRVTFSNMRFVRFAV